MARLARAVFPGHPHHLTQRGNGRSTTFFCDEDYALYRDLLAEHASASGVEVWAWVLMPTARTRTRDRKKRCSGGPPNPS
jgi:putative transposase